MTEWEFLEKEDYEEPACPLCTDAFTKKAGDPLFTVPIPRILEKLDEHLGHDDYDAGEKLLLYWLEEARQGRDRRGELAIGNELMGLYRKTGQKDAAVQAARDAMALCDRIGLSESVTGGTTLVNAATVLKAFGMAEDALPLYERATAIYRRTLPADDSRLGGLYNNKALALVDLRRFDEADACYRQAMAVMQTAENGELEQAITYLNMADAAVLRYGDEAAEKTVAEYVEKAWELLNAPHLPRNGYYAFVAEKCAPSFQYYGYFAYAAALEKRARGIYDAGN